MNESVYIRPMVEADIAGARLLLDQLGYDLTPTEIRRRYAVIANTTGHTMLLAECEARPVGLVHFYVRPALDKPPEMIVQAIVIDAAYRGRGIGKILMSAAEGWASARGYNSVALYSNVSRSGAHSFYETLGYQLIATSHLFRRKLRK
jgi:GNAT superfamily N-acetyltransferase